MRVTVLTADSRVPTVYTLRVREVPAHHEGTPEEGRLRSGWGVRELARTQELILRHLPPPPCRILDVGGGTIYWLAERGTFSTSFPPRSSRFASALAALLLLRSATPRL